MSKLARAERLRTSRSRLLVLALSSIVLVAAGLPRRAAPRVPPGPLTVSVENAADGAVLRGVVVHIGGRWAATAPDGKVVFDGIPAGDYRLEVRHPGFDRLEQGVTLAAGVRERMELALNPSPMPKVTGKVMTAQGVALVGAEIRLEPVEVAASVHGPCALRTSWDGTFLVPRIPPGRYRADVLAAGCEPHQGEVEIAPAGAELAFVLVPTTETASLEVRVADAVSGQPIAGARLIVAEAWPAGITAEMPTGSDGAATLVGLVTGRLNRTDAEGRCAIVRQLVTVRAEAEGYAPFMTSARIGSDETVELRLTPTAPVEEQEAGGSAIQDILPGCPVQVRIHPEGDVDPLRFRLPCPGRLVTRIGPVPIATCALLTDPAGKELAGSKCYANGNINFDLIVGPGAHVLEIGAWGAGESETLFRVQVDFEPCPDPFEPNDDGVQARTLFPGEEARGWIAPAGDVDAYAFRMERPGWMRAMLPPVGWPRHLRLLDRTGTELRSWSCYGNGNIVAEQNLAAGSYRLEVGWWGSGASTEPYTLRLETIEDDGIDDPPAPSAVRTLTLPGVAMSTILPNADHDAWLVPIPGPGLLTISSQAAIPMHVRLLSRSGLVLGEHTHYANGTGWTRIFRDGADSVIVEARCWGDGASSPIPFLIESTFGPADEWDSAGRNDTLALATPWELSEPLRASIMPVRDVDLYRFTIDHPGWLRLEVSDPVVALLLRLHDDGGTKLADTTAYARGTAVLERAVLPGSYVAEVRCWGDGVAAPEGYLLRGRLLRAEPEESVPLDRDAVRTLTLGEGRSWTIDQVGDVDHFAFAVPREGIYTLLVSNPLAFSCHLSDELTGETVAATNNYGNGEARIRLDAKGPTRYRAAIQCWGSGRSHLSGYILLREGEGGAVFERLEVAVDPLDPTLATFTRQSPSGKPTPGAMEIDADGDGAVDTTVPAGGSATWRYPSEGVYAARGRLAGPDGTAITTHAWVEAIGPQERRGVHLVVDHPAEGATVADDGPVRARALSWTGQPIVALSATVDGRAVGTDLSAPFAIDLPWRTLGGGEHVMEITARDRGGESATVERRFRVSDYFDLQPEDGVVVTGDDVRVSWLSGSFTPSVVRCRKQGEAAWREVIGESGRRHGILLGDLEAGVTYEIQPAGGAEAGPIHSVTRVKGLAFSRSVFGAKIQRDYDQRVPITVRNHGEEPMQVRLVCGKPEDPSLLLGFVGEGSEDAPFALGPGEERDVLLCFSAQDVNTAEHRLPVRITSESGYSDEAEVQIEVRLPRVELVWEDLGESQDGLGRRFRLRNAGDALTDLGIRASEGIAVDPQLDHGFFAPGASLEVSVRADIYDGFESVTGSVTASAVGQEVAQEVTFALAEGQRIYAVSLLPGSARDRELDPEEAERLEARSLVGALLDAGTVDWSQRGDPRDSDGDGRLDTWSVDNAAEGILWTGQDTDGDGEIDFARADIGYDGQVDHVAALGKDGWEPTNLLEAWLDVKFTLPWSRSAYHPHDVDVVVNGVVVGKLRDEIPEGSYSFRIPPTVIRYDDTGRPSGNEVGINSTHLRGGHYVLGSDFTIRARLSGARGWVVAGSEEEAREKVQKIDGVAVDEPAYTVSSAEIEVSGDPKPGEPVEVTVPLRNLGATAGYGVVAALYRGRPGEPGEEVDRQVVRYLPAGYATPLRFRWTARPGNHTLRVVLDPEGEAPGDGASRGEAFVSVSVPGDDTPPEVKLTSLAAGAVLRDAVVPLGVAASDDGEIAGVEVRVDGGLYTPLAVVGNPGFAGKALLQPGEHTLTVRARDAAGNASETSTTVKVDVPVPELRFLEPEEGAAIEKRRVTAALGCGADVALAMARVDGGPWTVLALDAGEARGDIALHFGACRLEARVVNRKGVEAVAERKVVCKQQRAEKDEEPEPDPDPDPDPEAPSPADTTLDIEGLGPVDVADPGSRVIPPAGGGGGTRPPLGPLGPGAGGDEPDEGFPPIEVDPAAWEDMDALEEDLGETTDTESFDGTPGDLDPEEAEAPEGEPWGDAPDAPLDGEVPPPMEGGALPTWECTIPPPEPPPPAGPPTGATARRPPSLGGGAIVVKKEHKNRYCTNNPNIRGPFRLPPEIMNRKFPPPGTAAYERMVRRFLDRLRERGIDPTYFEKFQKALIRRASQVDQPGELPNFLQSLGFGYPKYESKLAKEEMREHYVKAAEAWYLKLLSSEDPMLIAQGLGARMESLGKFDEALAIHADAMMTEIQNNQRAVEMAMYLYGPAGLALDIVNCARGETLSGDKMTKLHYGLVGLFRLGPIGLKALAKTPRGQAFISWAGTKAAWMGDKAAWAGRGAKWSIEKALGPERAQKLMASCWEQLTRQRSIWNLRGAPRMSKAAADYMRQAEAAAAKARLSKDIARGNQLIDKIRNAGSKQEYRELVLQLQSNKTAIAQINLPHVPPALRVKINKTLAAFGKLTDRRTIKAILNSKGGQATLQKILAKNPGLKPGDITVRARTISGQGATTVGRDRDVWYQWVTRDGKLIGDVHHDLSAPIYNRELEAVTGMTAEQLDHCVTSWWHPEAYNTGKVDPMKLVNGELAGKLPRPEDVRDTILHKCNHFFKQARELRKAGRIAEANRATTEGMRQALKEYGRQLAPLIEGKDLARGAVMPPRLHQGLKIFQEVQEGLKNGSYTVEAAEQALQSISCRGPGGVQVPLTPETIASDLAHYVEMVNKWGLPGMQ